MLTVKIEGLESVKRTLEKIPREMRDKAIAPAINKVAEKARAEINRAIRQEFAVKADEVRNAIEIRKARRDKLEAVISIFGSAKKRGRSLNMIHFLAAVQAAGRAFKVRGKKLTKADIAALQGQLGFLIKKGGGIKKIEGSFIGNKGRTVFMRTGKARLPIKPVQVIGFSQMFNTKRISSRVMQKISDDLPVEVDRAIQMLISKGLL